jgi:murein DD-endopeptidase MepM/ murein hydrolase activator NlpD
VLVDGLATERDYFYAHLRAPTRLGEGDDVRTGDRIGEVGKTGNARSEFCQLHFELWPDGYHRGGPVDPLGPLREWDSFS